MIRPPKPLPTSTLHATTPSTQWLTALKAVQIHRVAVALGTPCSGTKTLQIQGIRDALTKLRASTPVTRNLVSETRNVSGFRAGDSFPGQREVRVVSVDMGIRNLAYSCWNISTTSSTSADTAGGRSGNNGEEFNGSNYNPSKPVLKAWRKIDVSSLVKRSWCGDGELSTVTSLAGGGGGVGEGQTEVKEKEEKKEKREKDMSFEPRVYADIAYEFISSIIRVHNPTHILIERQRFRTGGSSAVTEWSLRVGVFEGMLYAVARSLLGQNEVDKVQVEGVLPGRVNRFWFDGGEGRKSGREVKMAKIEIVRRMLGEIGRGVDTGFTVDQAGEGVEDVVAVFVQDNKRKKEGKKGVKSRGDVGRKGADDIGKLDDLADCFLQGLAWLKWQENRRMVDKLGEEALLSLIEAVDKD